MDESIKKDGSRISPMAGVMMVLLGLAFDGVQAFLNLILVGAVLNWVVSFYAWLTFFVILKLRGISMAEAKGAKVLIALGAAFGIELVPIFNTLPAWTAFAVIAIISEYAENAPVIGKAVKKANKAASFNKLPKTASI